MHKGIKWTIRAVVTLFVVIMEASLGSVKTLDPGSVLVAMLLVLAGGIWVWYITRTRKQPAN
jgi:hypothetical protein